MGRPKQQALRELVILHYQSGISNSQIFQMLGGKVSQRTVSRWIKEFNDSGKTIPKKSTGRPRSAANQINKRKVKRLIKDHSGRQIAAKLNISKGSVVNIFKELNLTVMIYYALNFLIFISTCQLIKGLQKKKNSTDET